MLEDTQGLLLNATEIDPDTTQSTHELPTLDTNESDLMGTTPMVENDAEADSHVGDSITLSTQGGYNGPCVVGDFKRQMTGILNISHLRHSPNAM